MSPYRINRTLRQKLKAHGCFICGTKMSVDIDHIRTRGAGGDDSADNLLPLCRSHHMDRHRMGLKSFTTAYRLPIDISGIYPKLQFEWKL